MDKSVKGAAKRLLFSLTVVAALGGCAVYDAGYGTYGTYGGVSAYDYYGGPVYPAAPVYGYGPVPLYSAPAYVPSPVFQFNYRSGGGYRRHGDHGYGHGRGWRNGDHRFRSGGDRGPGRGPGGGFRGGHGRH